MMGFVTSSGSRLVHRAWLTTKMDRLLHASGGSKDFRMSVGPDRGHFTLGDHWLVDRESESRVKTIFL